jgi:hypothetical protein
MAEEFSFQEVEEILEGILNGRKLVKIETSQNTAFIVFYHPTADEILHSRYIREKTRLEAKKEKLPSIEDIDKMLAEREVITDEDKAKIKELEDKLVAQRRLLQVTKIAGRRKPIEEAIEKYSKEINELKSKSEAYYYLSQEKKADEESMLYLAWAASYTAEGKRYWPTFEDFEKETDLLFRNELVYAHIIFNKGLLVKTIRYIARHSLWRIRYTAALKTGGPLFVRGLDDLTPDQINLLYWSNYYQSIFEMLPDEQPDEETIKDDEALDKFMDAYFKKRQEERNAGRVKRRGATSGKQKLSAWDRGEELIITPAHPEYQSLAYSETRVKSPDGASDVDVVAPASRRARNKRARGKTRIRGGAKARQR